MYVLLQIGILVISLVLLERGADWLVEGASSLGERFHVSELFIGLTVVAFGTSAPEFAVSLVGALQHKGGIAIGNVIGSNIANIALILGITLMMGKIVTKKKTLMYEIPFLIAVQLSATMLFLKDGYFDYHDGIILLAFLAIFLVYAVSTSKSEFIEEVKEVEAPKKSLLSASLLTIVGLAGVTAGGELGVYSAVNIARSLHVSETLIATTIVAFGTSVPELATSLKAASKSKKDLALGNVIGSNMFNILGVLGVSSLFSRISPDRNVNVDLLFMNGIGILLFLIFLNRHRSAKGWKGVILVVSYVLYIVYGIMMR
ncbi:calcium/sodium antiporter [Mesoaciditoga lauensis]|uniref:calcium/sodium antiporter n=1 Tax=Mesoaciditoga lauensis TaxID=1495039 RepID=UPI00068947F3|nr:calcium/sodium antiporter [Mesoaciditoga lauensis]